MSTLRELKEANYRITLYCTTPIGLCTHSWEPSWDQLIQYLGADFDLTGDRSAMRRLRCEKCGSRGASVICVPAKDPRTQGVLAWNHASPSSEVMQQLHREDTRTRAAMDAQFAASAAANAERRREAAERKARQAIESGRDPIGPPNPWAHRKRGRWL